METVSYILASQILRCLDRRQRPLRHEALPQPCSSKESHWAFEELEIQEREKAVERASQTMSSGISIGALAESTA